MIERAKRRAPMRLAVTSLLVATGVGAVGVVPALAAGNSPAPAAFHSDDDHGRGHHDRWFRDRGDVRYVWFRVCDTDTTTATAAAAPVTTTTETPVAGTPTDAVASDAITAAVEGAATETATATDDTTTTDAATATDIVTGETTTTGTTTIDTPTIDTPTTEAAAVDEDDPDAKVYPTFIVVPLPKDEARALRKLDERPCYDLTTRAPATTDTTTTTTPTDAVVDPGTTVETTTTTPVDTAVTG